MDEKPRSIVIATSGFYIMPAVPHDVVRLDWIPLSADGSSPGRQFLFPVLM